MISKKLLLTTLSALCLFGCTSNTKKSDTEKKENKVADVFKNNTESQTQGSLQNGYTDAEKNPSISYTYNGKDLDIPYYVMNKFNQPTTIGIVIFVNGVPQKYTTDEHNEMNYLQEWTLNAMERKDMNLHFTPSVGVTGDKLGLYIGMVFKPDFKASKEKPIYGNNGNINFNTPISLTYATNIPNAVNYENKDLVSTVDYTLNDSADDGALTDMILDWNLPIKSQMNLYQTKKSMYDISFNMKGGPNCHYKVFAFVDNAPVKINDSDFLSVDMKENKMLTYDFKLDANTMPKSSTLYMIAIPDNNDFTSETANICQSGRILLVNDEK